MGLFTQLASNIKGIASECLGLVWTGPEGQAASETSGSAVSHDTGCMPSPHSCVSRSVVCNWRLHRRNIFVWDLDPPPSVTQGVVKVYPAQKGKLNTLSHCLVLRPEGHRTIILKRSRHTVWKSESLFCASSRSRFKPNNWYLKDDSGRSSLKKKERKKKDHLARFFFPSQMSGLL